MDFSIAPSWQLRTAGSCTPHCSQPLSTHQEGRGRPSSSLPAHPHPPGTLTEVPSFTSLPRRHMVRLDTACGQTRGLAKKMGLSWVGLRSAEALLGSAGFSPGREPAFSCRVCVAFTLTPNTYPLMPTFKIRNTRSVTPFSAQSHLLEDA